MFIELYEYSIRDAKYTGNRYIEQKKKYIQCFLNCGLQVNHACNIIIILIIL